MQKIVAARIVLKRIGEGNAYLNKAAELWRDYVSVTTLLDASLFLVNGQSSAGQRSTL
jgi:hypothetical protein